MLRAMSKVAAAGRAYEHAAPRQIYSYVQRVSGRSAGLLCSAPSGRGRMLGTNDATYNGRVLSMRTVSGLSSTIYSPVMSIVGLYACVRSSPAHSRTDSLG
jgi:hypothetical protein